MGVLCIAGPGKKNVDVRGKTGGAEDWGVGWELGGLVDFILDFESFIFRLF